MKKFLVLSFLVPSLIHAQTTSPTENTNPSAPSTSKESTTPSSAPTNQVSETTTNSTTVTESQNSLSQTAQKSSTSASAQPMNLKSAMSAKEQKAAGLNRLSPSQLKNLNEWVHTYVQNQQTQPESVGKNQVSTIMNQGQYLKLGGGEVWNVNPNAWIYTYYWQKGDPISVTKSNDLLFPILLTNEKTGQSVGAQKPNKEIEKAFSKSYDIKQIDSDGQYIELSDGTRWQIEQGARYMVQGWSAGSPIYVVQVKQAAGKPYALFNGETSRTVYAVPVKTTKN